MLVIPLYFVILNRPDYNFGLNLIYVSLLVLSLIKRVHAILWEQLLVGILVIQRLAIATVSDW